MQLVALGVGEYALEGEFDVQGVLPRLLLAVVVFDLDRDAGQRDTFLLGVQLEGQGLAGTQGRVEVVVWLGCRAFAPRGHRDIGKELMVIDLDAVTKTFAGLSVDDNGHG
ncbi:hypothetical protein D3C75_967210 [compost metagenome]